MHQLSHQAQVGAIVEKKQGMAKTYFNTSDMRYIYIYIYIYICIYIYIYIYIYW